MGDMVVVRSKVKTHADGCNVSGDFANALNDVVVELIGKAAARAKANNRKTVASKDL
jgi:histone H3/H4